MRFCRVPLYTELVINQINTSLFKRVVCYTLQNYPNAKNGSQALHTGQDLTLEPTGLPAQFTLIHPLKQVWALKNDDFLSGA